MILVLSQLIDNTDLEVIYAILSKLYWMTNPRHTISEPARSTRLHKEWAENEGIKQELASKQNVAESRMSVASWVDPFHESDVGCLC